MKSVTLLHMLLIWGPILAGAGAFLAISRMGKGKQRKPTDQPREEGNDDGND